MKKNAILILVACLFINLFSVTAFAEVRGNEYGTLPPAAIQEDFESGNQMNYTDSLRAQGWVQVGNRWRYQLLNGTYVTNQWYMVGNRWYHFDGSGYMQTGWFQDTDGKWYYLHDSEGYMMIKWVNSNGKWYYMDEHGVMQTGIIHFMDTNTYFGFKNTGELYYTDLSVPFEFQRGNYWCWAACASMVGHYKVPNTDVEQEDLVRYIYGDEGDGPEYGTWDKVVAPAITALYGIQAHGDDVTRLTYSESTDKLMNYKPFMSQVRWSGGGYHDIVGKGYNEDTETIFYLDPGASPSDTELELNYTDFVNGCSFPSGAVGSYICTLYLE